MYSTHNVQFSWDKTWQDGPTSKPQIASNYQSGPQHERQNKHFRSTVEICPEILNIILQSNSVSGF